METQIAHPNHWFDPLFIFQVRRHERSGLKTTPPTLLRPDQFLCAKIERERESIYDAR